MEPLRRIHRLWNWLPAFRAVAETEHLPTASELLAVSPSALSRSIKLIEEDVGAPLFEREGRNLRLNAAGEAFLAAVRDAMRRVHDGIGEIEGSHLSGSLRIGAAGLMASVQVPDLLVRLKSRHPRVAPTVVSVSFAEETASLLTGRIDVSFTSWGQPHEATELLRLGEVSSGVWCGPGHPLHGEASVPLSRLLEHEFAAPLPDATGCSPEGWPPNLSREVGAYVETMQMGVELCARGSHLAVLPDPLAAARGGLHRLDFETLPPTPLFARRRVRVGPEGKVDLCIEEMRALLDEGPTSSTSAGPGPAS